MSRHQGTQNIGSGNDELCGPGIPAFLVVEHNDQKVAIKRQSDYQKTIASIKKSIHELRSSQDDHIVLLGFLAEVDDYVQITEEVWTDLLPRFLTIQVQLGNVPKNPPASSGTVEIGKDELPEDEIVHRAEEEDVSDTSDTSLSLRMIERIRPQAAARAKLKDGEEAERRRQQQVASEASAWTAFLPPPRSKPSETVTIDDDGFATVPGQRKWRPSRGRGRGMGGFRGF